MTLKPLILRLLLSSAALVAALVCAELALHVYHAGKGPEGPIEPNMPVGDIPMHIIMDSPVPYALNPEHPEVNSCGLRGDEIIVSKPGGVFRVLILGDSVTYGTGVTKDQTFAARLEELLRDIHNPSEVLNAGVQGYTTYNELKLYSTKGKSFQPDLVVLAVCLNDVVNPRLHWVYTRNALTNIPDAAIPNLEYDREHALPLLESRAHEREAGPPSGWLDRSRLYQAVHRSLPRVLREDADAANDYRPSLTAPTPTYLTGEDRLSIEVLLDPRSPEFRWLVTLIGQLHDEVVADGGRFLVVLLPLAYQLDHAYPHIPQTLLCINLDACGITCLDLLPALRVSAASDVFLLWSGGYYDVWHLSRRDTKWRHQPSSSG